MTDDEINAALLPMIAKHIKVAQADCRILPLDRIAYRAGMREAARIARNVRPGYDVTDHYAHAIIEITALCIELAAGGER